MIASDEIRGRKTYYYEINEYFIHFPEGGRDMERHYSVREICELCGVTRKQLRYYEECGVLFHVGRNEENNYRYYTAQHIYEIIAAKALRRTETPVAQIKEIIYAGALRHIETCVGEEVRRARLALGSAFARYEQMTMLYEELLRAGRTDFPDGVRRYLRVSRPEREVVALSYQATFEDKEYHDVCQLARLQNLAGMVHPLAFGSLIYLTYGHFDSAHCFFDGAVHAYKIAIPVVDQKVPCPFYDRLPAVEGISTLHYGDPKQGRLKQTYKGLLLWAKENHIALADCSEEEWLVSPLITSNKKLWVIRVTVPFAQ